MVNFMLGVFYHKKKNETKEKTILPDSKKSRF